MKLHLVLKKKWFDMIASGEKKVEYRDIKPHWTSRLTTTNQEFKEFTEVEFQLGYQANAPRIKFAVEKIDIGKPNPNWASPGASQTDFYRIHLGESL